jgi:hypothetical protein
VGWTRSEAARVQPKEKSTKALTSLRKHSIFKEYQVARHPPGKENKKMESRRIEIKRNPKGGVMAQILADGEIAGSLPFSSRADAIKHFERLAARSYVEMRWAVPIEDDGTVTGRYAR